MFVPLDGLLPIMSLGVAFASSERIDAGLTTSTLVSVELLTQGYLPLPLGNIFLRPGARLGVEFQPSDTPDTPIRISEKGYKAGAELGVVYNGIVVPTVSLHSMVLMRQLSLKKPEDVPTRSNLVDNTEWLFSNNVTIGLGIPLQNGRLLVEPFYRFVQVSNDERKTYSVGLDLSYALELTTTAPL